MKPIRIGFASALLAVALTYAAQKPQDIERQFKAARNAELVDGDPRSAIALYKKVADSGIRPYAAQALLRMAESYKALGDPKARTATLELIARKYGDEKDVAAKARALMSAARNAGGNADEEASELRVRTLWQGEPTDTTGRVSYDGRYLSFVDRRANGGLAVRDLLRGENSLLVKAGAGVVGPSAISRSGRDIAYAWRANPGAPGELRVVGIDGTRDRLAYSNAAVAYLHPMDWTPDGRIVVLASTQDGVSQIAIVDPNRSQIQKLKTFLGSQNPANMAVSNDGRFIIYDAPQDKGPAARDVFALTVDGGFVEYPVVEHPANDTVLGWTSDSRVLFASDRGGATAIWAVETLNGKPSLSPPLRLTEEPGLIRSLGMIRSGSLIYSLGETQVRSLDNVLSEIARLQLAPFRQPVQSSVAKLGSIEGIVVRRGTTEPISGAEVELVRMEGTAAFPHNPGAAEAFAALSLFPGPAPEPPIALAPEVQYATTGGDGRFVFRNLKPGGYRLVAARNGGQFHPARYGQRDPRGPGLVFPLAEGQTFGDAKLEMASVSVITGRVFDPEGRPLGHARVLAMEVAYRQGRRILITTGNVFTDEHGEYRLYALPPGRYTVAAKIEEKSEVLSGRGLGPAEEAGSPVVTWRVLPGGEVLEETHRLVYYGDVLDPNLVRFVEVGFGSSSFSGADIHLVAGRVRSHHIRGVLINGVTGQPEPGVQIRAVPLLQSPHAIIPFDVTDARGAFDLLGAVPGSYAVLSSAINVVTPGQRGARGAASTTPLSANVQVEVGNTDIESLRIVALAAPDIAGRVVIEGRAPEAAAVDLAKMQVFLSWDPNIMGMGNQQNIAALAAISGAPLSNEIAGSAAFGPVRENGSFAIPTRSGQYRVGVSGIPSTAYVKSIRTGDADVLANGLRLGEPSDSPLEIVITDRSGELRGTAVNANAAAMPNVVVALVPDSPLLRQRSDLYKSTTTDAGGRFRLWAIAPGTYKLFAWEYAEPGVWHDAQFMQAYETSGKSIQVGEGRNQDIQLTVIPLQRPR